MLVETEREAREARRIDRLHKFAKLEVSATPEDIDYRNGRGIDRRQIIALLHGDWIAKGQDGPLGEQRKDGCPHVAATHPRCASALERAAELVDCLPHVSARAASEAASEPPAETVVERLAVKASVSLSLETTRSCEVG